MEDQALDQVHLLGHSMGGKIAMTLALMVPERIKSLTVIDIAPVTYTERRHDAILKGMSSIDLTAVQKRSDAEQQMAKFEPVADVRQFLMKNLYKNSEGAFDWRVNLGSIIEHYDRIMEGQRSEAGYQGPTLFLKGGESDYLQPEHKTQVVKLFPKARVRVISGAGHWVHAQKPELVVRSMLRFLGKR